MNYKEILKQGIEALTNKVASLSEEVKGGDASKVTDLNTAQTDLDSMLKSLNDLEAKEKEDEDAEEAKADKAIEDAKKAVEDVEEADAGEEEDGSEEDTETEENGSFNTVDTFSKNFNSTMKKSKLIKPDLQKEINSNPGSVKQAVAGYYNKALGRVQAFFETNGISIKEGAGKKLLDSERLMEVLLADKCISDPFLSRILTRNIIARDEFQGAKSWDKTIRDGSQLLVDYTCEVFDCVNEADDFTAPCDHASHKIKILYACLYGSCYVNKMAECLSIIELVNMSLDTLGNNMIETIIFKMFRDDCDAALNINAYDKPDAFADTIDWKAVRNADKQNHWMRYAIKKVGGNKTTVNPAVTPNAQRGIIASAVKGPLYCNEKGDYVKGNRSPINAGGDLVPAELDRLIRSIHCGGDKSNLLIATTDCGEEIFENMDCNQCNKYLIALDGGKVRDFTHEWRGVPIVNVRHMPNLVNAFGGVNCTDLDGNDKCMFIAINMDRIHFGYPCETKNDTNMSVKGTNTEIAGAFAYGLNDSPLNDKPAVCALLVTAPKSGGAKSKGTETELPYRTDCNCKPTDVEPTEEDGGAEPLTTQKSPASKVTTKDTSKTQKSPASK